jgi:hypothetical protein
LQGPIAQRSGAERYCAAIAGAAAYFMQSTTYALVIAGEASVTSAENPGSVSFRPAKFEPTPCPKPVGALVDPVRANEPRTPDDAINRFVRR